MTTTTTKRRSMHTTYCGRKMHQFNGTWLGRAGTSYDSSRGTGLRITVHIWDGDDTARVRVVSGDGRTPDFLTIHDGEVPVADWERTVESLAGVYNAVRWPR